MFHWSIDNWVGATAIPTSGPHASLHATLLPLNEQLAAFADVEAWIQVACPRLSVDWGHFFDRVCSVVDIGPAVSAKDFDT